MRDVDAAPFRAYVTWLAEAGWEADIVALAANIPLAAMDDLTHRRHTPRWKHVHAKRLLACTPASLRERSGQLAPADLSSALRRQVRWYGLDVVGVNSRRISYATLWQWQLACAGLGKPYSAADLLWDARATLAA